MPVREAKAIALQQRTASHAFGHWIEHVDWDLRLVITFSPSKLGHTSHDLALRRVRDGMNWLGGYLRGPVAWLAFTEPTMTGHVHVHALLVLRGRWRPSSALLRKWNAWWRRRNGYVRMQKYTKGLAGAIYDAKYSGSSETEWDCSNAFTDLMRSQTPKPGLPAENRCRVVR